MSFLLAVVVTVGVVPPAHATVDQETVLLPPFVLIIRVKLLPDAAVGIVIVGEPPRDTVCMVPLARLIVIADA